MDIMDKLGIWLLIVGVTLLGIAFINAAFPKNLPLDIAARLAFGYEWRTENIDQYELEIPNKFDVAFELWRDFQLTEHTFVVPKVSVKNEAILEKESTINRRTIRAEMALEF